MGYPSSDDLLPGEKVVEHLHQHWKVFISPVLAGGAVALGLGIVMLFPITLPVLAFFAAVAFAMFCWLAIWPLVKWYNWHYVLTDQRLLIRHGVGRQHHQEIQLNQINHTSFDHLSFTDRLLRTGDLKVMTYDENPLVLTNLPRAKRMRREIARLAAKASEDGGAGHQRSSTPRKGHG